MLQCDNTGQHDKHFIEFQAIDDMILMSQGKHFMFACSLCSFYD